MALEQTSYYYDFVKDPGLTLRLARDRLTRIGVNEDDVGAWGAGYARLWLDDPANPYVYGRKIAGVPTLNETQRRAEQVNTWQEYTPEGKRARITAAINAQIYETDAAQLVEDPLAARAVEATSGGASNRRSDLEDTPDQDLDGFDATITPTSLDGAGFVEARQTTFIDIVDPWAGAPQDVYAMVVWLEVMSDTGDEGAEARAHMFGPKDGPAGAVLPFVRDAGNPKLWRAQSQEGRYWSNPDETASMRLLWANGSVPVDSTKELAGYGDRDYSIVRYGG